jgi:hypothetical protein
MQGETINQRYFRTALVGPDNPTSASTAADSYPRHTCHPRPAENPPPVNEPAPAPENPRPACTRAPNCRPNARPVPRACSLIPRTARDAHAPPALVLANRDVDRHIFGNVAAHDRCVDTLSTRGRRYLPITVAACSVRAKTITPEASGSRSATVATGSGQSLGQRSSRLSSNPSIGVGCDLRRLINHRHRIVVVEPSGSWTLGPWFASNHESPSRGTIRTRTCGACPISVTP